MACRIGVGGGVVNGWLFAGWAWWIAGACGGRARCCSGNGEEIARWKLPCMWILLVL